MPIVAKNLLNIEDIDVELVCVIPSDIKLVTLSLRSVSRSHVSKKKYNLVSLSQLNTLNNTDTVIDLNLHKTFDRSALQHWTNKELFQQEVPFIMSSWKEKLVHL